MGMVGVGAHPVPMAGIRSGLGSRCSAITMPMVTRRCASTRYKSVMQRWPGAERGPEF
jgi:hypothetical protein